MYTCTSLKIALRSIECPSHDIRSKCTATKAVVQTLKNQALGDGFLMYVELAEIHVPRMWVEQHPERDSQVQTRLVNLLTPQTASYR